MDRYIKNPMDHAISEVETGVPHTLAGLYAAPVTARLADGSGYLAGVRQQDALGTAKVSLGDLVYADRDSATTAAEKAAIAALRPFDVSAARINQLRPGDQVLMGSLHGSRVENVMQPAALYNVVGGATAGAGPVVRYAGATFAPTEALEVDSEGFLIGNEVSSTGIIAFSPFQGVSASDPNLMLRRLLEAVMKPEMLLPGDQVLIKGNNGALGVAQVERVTETGYDLKLMESQAQGPALPAHMTSDLHGNVEGVGRVACASTTRFAPEEGRDALMHLAYDRDNATWIGYGNGVPLNELVPESLIKPARYAFNVNPQVLTALAHHDTVIFRSLPHTVTHLDASKIGLYCPMTQRTVETHRDGQGIEDPAHRIEAVLQASHGTLTHYAVRHAYADALAKRQLLNEPMLDTDLHSLRAAKRGDTIALYTPSGKMISAQVARPAGGLTKETVMVVTTTPGERQQPLNISISTGACLETSATFAGRFNYIPRGRTPQEVFRNVVTSCSEDNEAIHYLSAMNVFLRDCGFSAHGTATSDLAGLDGRATLKVDLEKQELSVKISVAGEATERTMGLYSEQAREKLEQLRCEFPAFSAGMNGHRFDVAEAPATRVRSMAM